MLARQGQNEVEAFLEEDIIAQMDDNGEVDTPEAVEQFLQESPEDNFLDTYLKEYFRKYFSEHKESLLDSYYDLTEERQRYRDILEIFGQKAHEEQREILRKFEADKEIEKKMIFERRLENLEAEIMNCHKTLLEYEDAFSQDDDYDAVSISILEQKIRILLDRYNGLTKQRRTYDQLINMFKQRMKA